MRLPQLRRYRAAPSAGPRRGLTPALAPALAPAVAVAVALGLSCPAAALARGAAAAATGPLVAVAPEDSLHVAGATLARAVVAWRAGDLREAADLLGELDLSPASAFPRADRAAFLLGVLERRLGRPAALRAKVAAAADASSRSPYRRWLAHLERWDAVAAGVADPPAVTAWPADDGGSELLPADAVLEAAWRLERGDAAGAVRLLDRVRPDAAFAVVHEHLLALALARAGLDPEPAWRRLAEATPATPSEGGLVAAAGLELARRERERGGHVEPWLGRVADVGTAAGRAAGGEASRLLALAALARGDTATARDRFAEALARPLPGTARRQVRLELGALAEASGDWTAAAAAFDSAAADWQREDAALASLLADGRDAARDSAWSAWTRDDDWSGELRLATRPLDRALDLLAEAALDLRDEPAAEPAPRLAAALAAEREASGSATVAPAGSARPTPGELDAWRERRDRATRAIAQLAERDRDVMMQRHERERRLTYLDQGRRHAGAESDSLAAGAARLAAAGPRLDAALVAMRRLQAQLAADFAARTARLEGELRRNALYAEAVRHFHADGPPDPRRRPAPAGAPRTAALLGQEIALADSLAALARDFGAAAPGWLDRSRREAWEPGLLARSAQLRRSLDAQRLRNEGFVVALAARRAGAEADAELARREGERAAAALSAQAARDSLRALRVDVARAVGARGRIELAREREGIDYHRLDAAYWQAVALATAPETTADRGPVASSRELALAYLDTFLARYPRSEVLSETRFRRADLELFRARDEFRARLASWVGDDDGDGRAARALAPHFDGGNAVALYEAILRDDPGFAHCDAVLFNLGMILDDSGQPGAEAVLTRLVTEHPDAAGAQEAWLRLGNGHFEAGEYALCVGPYGHAAAGGDPALALIALYRLGWARFATDAFAEAAIAFGRLLDLPRAAVDGSAGAAWRRRDDRVADLHAEAEDHLVQSLLRAGGALAFERHIDRAGTRPWDPRVLAAMAKLAAKYSLTDDAVACDELWLRRYPDSGGALAVAEHLAATLEAGGHADAARQARLAQAPRFLPGSAWQAAVDSLALRERADRFARLAYEQAAVFEHQSARAGRDTTAWARALGHYETALAHWPAAAEAPRLHYQAGEAARELHDHRRALAHFAAAAASDTASFAVDAAWQAVAVRDAWYRDSVPATGSAGADSLATALLAAGDDFRQRHPDDARDADLAWRQGQVAYAHGRDEDAARRLLDFSTRHATDPRAAGSARLAGDALYRRHDLAAAGDAYDRALTLANAAGDRRLAAELGAVLPHCAYERAAAAAAADSAATGTAAAALYLEVATRWPASEQAPPALYRAGLGFAAAGDTSRAVAAWERLVGRGARVDYARDAAVQLAQVAEAGGHRLPAADAWVRYGELFPDSEDATAALLRAIDLHEAARDTAGAERLRDVYLRRYPADLETAFAFGETRARRELASGRRGPAVRRYLDLARSHPQLAAVPLLAAVDYAAADEALRTFEASPLTQPLPASLARKNRRLEEAVALLNRCVERGDSEYAHAAAYRLGEAVIHLGEALLASERPASLAGDDLAAYDEVLLEQSRAFTTRGEDAWTGLLREADRASGADPGGWLARTESALWPRLARRYLHRPELDYPLAPLVTTAGAAP
jgi:hypothetical protein